MKKKAGERPGPGCGRHDREGRSTAGALPCFFDLSIDMLCIAGTDGYFKALNGAWEKALGFTPAELCAGPYLGFVHPDDRKSTRARARELADGKPALVFENRFRCRDGSYRWLSWNSRPVPEQGLVYAVVRDVTLQKQTKSELRTANEGLRAANEELTCMNEELTAMNEELTATEEELRRQVAELKSNREALDQTNRELRAIIDFLPDATMVIDSDGRVLAWNQAMEALTGTKQEAVIGRGEGTPAVVIWGERRPVLADAILRAKPDITALYENVRREGEALCGEIFVPHLSGGRGAHVWVKASPLYDHRGRITGAIEAVRDITKEKQTRRALQEANEGLQAANEELVAMNEEHIAANEELMAAEEELRQQIAECGRGRRELDRANRQLLDIIGFLPDATVVVGNEGKVMAWNRAMEALTGTKKEGIIGRAGGAYARAVWGKTQPMLVDAILSEQPELVDFYGNVRRTGDSLYTEVFVPGAYSGRGAFVWVKASPLYDRRGDITGAIESVRDITERKQFEDKLKYLGMHDPLTGLYNRRYFEKEMGRLQQEEKVPVGIILCDVDGLKLVNDSLGHGAGDRLLIAAADLVRGAFPETGVVARVGGDEFGVLLPGHDEKAVTAGVERIREAVRRHNGQWPEGMPLSLSVGYAVGAACPPDVTALYQEAEHSMCREKLHHTRSARSATVQTLMKALEARDFITEGHADRLQELLARVGEELGLSPRKVGDLRLLAQFHDIGKVGIPDRILFKPGPLTPEEMKEMRRHSEIGYRIALSAPDLLPIADWILHHHEWWDGRGYPMGLKGNTIPLACRILAIADAYDAMTSDRPYRKAMPHAEAVTELKRCSGTQFDPELTPRFIRILEAMRAERARRAY